MDLSNVSYRLVDANFKPVKLLNPMYLPIVVNPLTPNPNTDISMFNGKLPRDKPTQRELVAIQLQQQTQTIEQNQSVRAEQQQTELILSQMNQNQQLQYLALPPETQLFYRDFLRRSELKEVENEQENELVIQQLAQTAPERMNPISQLMLPLLPPEAQRELISEQVAKEFQQLQQEKQLQQQQAYQESEAQAIQQVEYKEQQELQQIQTEDQVIDELLRMGQEEQAQVNDMNAKIIEA
jgi:hypothetical protein